MKNKVTDIHFLDIPEDLEYTKLINEVIEKAFYEEGLENKNIYIKYWMHYTAAGTVCQ